jgi:hypothetical protein
VKILIIKTGYKGFFYPFYFPGYGFNFLLGIIYVINYYVARTNDLFLIDLNKYFGVLLLYKRNNRCRAPIKFVEKWQS